MTASAHDLPVTVLVTPALLPGAEPELASLQRSIEAGLGELTSDLGVAAHPVVELEASESLLANDVMSLLVAGRPCRFPPTIIADALAYVDGSSRIAADSGEVLDRLQEQGETGGRRLAELFALVCRAAVSAQPGLLLAPTDSAATCAAVELGMSLAGIDLVADDDGVERLIAPLASKTIDVEVHPVHLRAISDENPSSELFRFARDGLFAELGLPLPDFHFRPDPSLHEAGFAFRINAVRTLPRIGLPADTILVNETVERLAALGVDAEPTMNPATHQPGALVARAHRESLESAGLTTWDRGGLLLLCLADAVRRNAHRLMTSDVAASLVEDLSRAFPALVARANARLQVDELARLLRELLLDAAPIRNLRRILELLLRYESDEDAASGSDRITFVRSGLADAIAFASARETDTVVTYLLDPEIERALAAALAGADDRLVDRLSDAVREELSTLPPTAMRPAVLTRDELRRPLSALLRPEFDRIRVLAYGDLPPSYNVQPVARISWG
jgi:type III secretory pathway component EscV